MVNVIYDEREWRIVISNKSCPHLFYPANIHGCRLSPRQEGECKLEDCPIRIREGFPIPTPNSEGKAGGR